MDQRIEDIIVKTAQKFIGQQEIQGNLGFKDEEFQQLMESVGWEKGQAWCAYFCELVWKEAYKQCEPSFLPELNILFSAGAVATWNNFKKSGRYIISNAPHVGALIVWQTYKKGEPYWTGHIGIVKEFYKDVIKTIEGNTNQSGGREGIEVAEKMRDLDFTIDKDKKSQLVLKGFIYPET